MKPMHEQLRATFGSLKDTLGYKNLLQAPRIEKVVVATGIGKIVDKQKITLIQERLARITGQKAAPTRAKQSIASFKLRQGDIVGYQVTLRGTRMEHFLDKLVHLALPNTRDFRGIPLQSIDEMGNLTIGVPEHTIFPETTDEELKDVFGLAVTVVTTASTRKEAEALLRHLGFPLQAARDEEEVNAA